jgi:hypothetical protein
MLWNQTIIEALRKEGTEIFVTLFQIVEYFRHVLPEMKYWGGLISVLKIDMVWFRKITPLPSPQLVVKRRKQQEN